MTEFAACHTCAETVIADTDRLILETVCEIVPSLCHGSNENADAFFRAQCLDVISDSHDFSVEAQGNLSTIWWQVIGDGVLDDFQELLL